MTAPNRFDPDLYQRLYSVEMIARSYQGTHQFVWNMPSNDEFLYALRINGHSADALDALKAEYTRVARAVGIKD
jgi:hypothetical protein